MKRNTNKIPQQSSDNILSATLIGGGIGIAVCILAVLLMPTILLNFDDPNSLTFIATAFCLILGSTTASITAANKAKNSKTLSGLLASAVLFVPILLISFFIPGDFNIITVLSTLAIIMLSGVCCSYIVQRLSANSKKNMKKFMKSR